MHVELKHTLSVDRNAPYIRLYVWLWEADLHKITFCKLFWAYVFIVPGLILRGLIGVVRPVAKRLERQKYFKKQKTPKITMKLEAPPSGPSIMQRVLNKIEHGMARVVMAIKTAWGVIGLDGKLALFLGRALIVLALLIGLAALGVIVWLLVEFSTARFIVMGGIALAVALAIIFGVIYALDRFGVWNVAGEGLGYGGRGVKRGVTGFFGAMRAGYVAVKSSTCPKIEVRDDT